MDRAAWEGILKQASDIIIDELSSHGNVGLLCQGDAAQVRSDDAQAQPTFHPVWPVIGAFAPAEVASQAGNAARGARALAIAPAPGTRALKRLAFVGELACSLDGHLLDPRGQLAVRSRNYDLVD